MQETLRLITNSRAVKSNLHNYLVDSDTPIYLRFSILALHKRELKNFLEAAEKLNYFARHLICLVHCLQFCEVA